MRARTILAVLAVLPLAVLAAPAAISSAAPDAFFNVCLTPGGGVECLHLTSGAYEVSNTYSDAFVNVGMGGWEHDSGNRTTWEYEANGTGNCITWNEGTGGYDLEPCGTFPAAQANWYDDSALLMNEQATTDYGEDVCMYASQPLNGYAVVGGACTSNEAKHNTWSE
jgi:hypothetical protein